MKFIIRVEKHEEGRAVYEIARMQLWYTKEHGWLAKNFRGRTSHALNQESVNRIAKPKIHGRFYNSPWQMVAAALECLGYGRKQN